MKTNSIYHLANIVCLLLALSLVGCASQPSLSGNYPAGILDGDIVTVFQGTAMMTLEQVMTIVRPGTQIMYNESTGIVVFTRPLLDGFTITYTRLSWLGDADLASKVTGYLMNARTYETLSQGLRDYGFKVVTASEVAALYTGQLISIGQAISSGTVSIIVAAPGAALPIDENPYIPDWIVSEEIIQ